jgi:hypothetical protein|tara:strand:- start:871 stop:1134 length:264 start_codon:yes stop_codon:yes gene_type:complete
MGEHDEKPYITIDDVRISVEDLPEEAQGIFGRIQRLNQKKVNLTLDIEEVQASLNFFTNKIVSIINEEGEQSETEVEEEEVVTKSEN